MKRLLLLALIVGCTDNELKGPEGAPATDAERMFVAEVLPMLQANCVVCHAGAQSDPTIAFLAGDSWQEIRETLLASEVIANELTRSPLLTKGAHSGPHLSAEQTSLLLRWLDSEGR
jgi:hypothetical protein